MPHGFRIEWHGHDVTRRIEGVLESRLNKAAGELRQETIGNISEPGVTAGRRRSRPDEFPRVDRGALKRSVFSDTSEELTRRILTDRKHGLWLETGTRTLQPRPFLTKTLRAMRRRIVEIVTAPLEARK